MRRRSFLATVGAASGAVLAGCGSAGDDPASQNQSGAGQQIGGDAQATTPDAASTPDDPATPDETTTPAETTETEASTADGTSTAEETSTPGGSGDGGRNSMEYPGEYIDVRDVTYDDNRDSHRGPTVTGVVQNVSTEKLSLVEAKVWSYDDGGTETGEALDDTTDLRPGETWEFDCELWDTAPDDVAYWKGRVDVSTY